LLRRDGAVMKIYLLILMISVLLTAIHWTSTTTQPSRDPAAQ
jgi:hypothetical protein